VKNKPLRSTCLHEFMAVLTRCENLLMCNHSYYFAMLYHLINHLLAVYSTYGCYIGAAIIVNNCLQIVDIPISEL